MLTDGFAPQAESWLLKLREAVDELVIFVDRDHADEHSNKLARATAHRVYETPSRRFFDAHMPDMVRACHGDWVLRIDSDEELSPEWLDGSWRRLLDLPEFTHFWLPRRWILPSGGFLACAPWWPDHQLRLFKMVPDLGMPKTVHEPLTVPGLGGWCSSLAIHHYVLAISSPEERERKIARYETIKPGGGLGHYYRFEDHNLPGTELPGARRLDLANELVRMDALSSADCGNISLRVSTERVEVDPRTFIWRPVQVVNSTDTPLVSSPPYPVRVSYHWVENGSRSVTCHDGERTNIFPALKPRQSADLMMFIRTPDQPGNYILRATLVQDGVRWFEDAAPAIVQETPVRVGA